MNISSMTGFARLKKSLSLEETDIGWTWEIRSVNGRFLDVKIKLPAIFEHLQQQLKTEAASCFSRGNVTATLMMENNDSDVQVRINEKLLEDLMTQLNAVSERISGKKESAVPADLLNVRGVVECRDNTLGEEAQKQLDKALVESFGEVCAALKADRGEEGRKIKKALEAIIANIEKVVGRIDAIADKLPPKIKEKLEEQLRQWLEPGNEISEDRLAQEIVFYVNRADVREEINRLQAHIKTAYELLNSDDTIGRRLDFLCQELGREANTTSSKSADIALTNAAVELKTLIEQLREQVQNIE